jgi:folate-binding protein YgfZ
MNPAWQAFLAQQAGYQDGADDFGTPADELAAARSAAVLVPLFDQGLITLDGPDATPFLHALATNDIAGLSDDGVRFAGMCSAKGRLLATFHAWRRPDGLALLVAADLQAAFARKLAMFVLRSKVKVTAVGDEVVLLGIGGPSAAAAVGELLGQAPAARQWLTSGDTTVLCLDAGRFVLALPAASAADLWVRAARLARPAGTAAWRLLEIAAGQPRVVAATQEAFVPQMVNMEVAEVGGVVFTKGCYPGQEIVARTQYLGKIKRRMFHVALDEAVAPGTDVFTPESAGQHCGAVVTVAPSPEGGFEALLVVQSSGAEVGEIHLGSAEGPRARLLALPYAVS